jgi:hypothetical protein
MFCKLQKLSYKAVQYLDMTRICLLYGIEKSTPTFFKQIRTKKLKYCCLETTEDYSYRLIPTLCVIYFFYKFFFIIIIFLLTLVPVTLIALLFNIPKFLESEVKFEQISYSVHC